MPSLTCLETFQFYAGLLLGHLPREERLSKIEQILDALDLRDNQLTLVAHPPIQHEHLL